MYFIYWPFCRTGLTTNQKLFLWADLSLLHSNFSLIESKQLEETWIRSKVVMILSFLLSSKKKMKWKEDQPGLRVRSKLSDGMSNKMRFLYHCDLRYKFYDAQLYCFALCISCRPKEKTLEIMWIMISTVNCSLWTPNLKSKQTTYI